MPAATEERVTDIQAEKAFVDSLSAKLEAGTEVKEPEPVKPATPKATPKAEKSTEPVADAEEAEEIEVDPEVVPEKEEIPATEVEPEKEEEEEQEEEEVIEDEDDESPDAKLAEEARAELAKHGLKMTMDDVPKEARPIIKARLDTMLAGYTRAMMEQRAYRKEEAEYRASKAFDEQHSDLRIMELLYDKDGKLNEDLYAKVNARMADLETESGRKLFSKDVRDERLAVRQAVEQESSQIEKIQLKADQTVTYLKRAASTLNLPFEALTEAVSARIALSEHPENGLTEQEVDAVIGQQQRIFARYAGKAKLTQRQSEIKGRTLDKKTVSPAAKGGGGSIVAPTGAKPPKNDEEFTTQFLAKQQKAG